MNIDNFTVDEIRNRTSRYIKKAVDADRPVLIEAPPNAGKTTSAFELAATADRPVTYFARRTDIYQEAKNWVEEQRANLECEIIPSPQRNCDTFKGKNRGNEDRLQRLYERGFSGRELHRKPSDEVYTPCRGGDDNCEYMEKLSKVEKNIDSIDLLIGNHQHARKSAYLKDRIVIFDEFNAQPFIDAFPSGTISSDIDHPGQIIPEFLNQVSGHDDLFPIDTYGDLTDLITHRDDEARDTVFEWFKEHGVTRDTVKKDEDYEFFERNTYRQDRTHLLAPLLTFSLLCMERVASGISLAPAPNDEAAQDAWNTVDIASGCRCIRDRNTGEMYLLRPPDLRPAAQVIGLDGLPTVELWELVFAPEDGFEHKQVVSRKGLSEYLSHAMNMSIIQIGGGMNHYAGGRISPRDGDRFKFVRAREKEKFPLIAPKQALHEYRNEGWLKEYTKKADERRDELYGGNLKRLVMNYGRMLSSNVFEKEELGVVSGAPYPGDHTVQRWAGFFGKEVTPVGEGTNKTFGEFGDKIYQHFVHHQVVQAILRFGRDEAVWQNEGATVYVNTKALPDWFTVNESISGSYRR